MDKLDWEIICRVFNGSILLIRVMRAIHCNSTTCASNYPLD